jgi:hypothetical protein
MDMVVPLSWSLRTAKSPARIRYTFDVNGCFVLATTEKKHDISDLALARVASETSDNHKHKSFRLMARTRASVLNWHRLGEIVLRAMRFVLDRMTLLLTSANTEASTQVPPVMSLVDGAERDLPLPTQDSERSRMERMMINGRAKAKAVVNRDKLARASTTLESKKLPKNTGVKPRGKASAHPPELAPTLEGTSTTFSPSPELEPTLEATPTSFHCPVCAEEMHPRFAGKGGKFWGCCRYPACRGTRSWRNPEVVGPKGLTNHP